MTANSARSTGRSLPRSRRRWSWSSNRQPGQPLPPSRVRLITVANHSWPYLHSHQTILLLTCTTSVGWSLPFFVGCQSRAIFFSTVASELVQDTRRLAQNGQPRRVRLSTIDIFHSWSGPFGHCHHTFRSLPGMTSSGRNRPLRVVCQVAATLGSTVASDRSGLTLLPAHIGQPVPWRARRRMGARHS